MKIDAREFMGDMDSRPFTLKGAVLRVIDSMSVGDSIAIESITDGYGKVVPKNRLQASLSQHANGRRFMTRDLRDGTICHIFRVQ